MEYIIALVIVMATVVTLAVYIGARVAGKWAALLVELKGF
jgi:hypothetical protein